MATALTALAGAVRFAGITRPPNFVFDEFYASDGCLYFFGPQGPCRTPTEISIVHPPLGKWLIGLGVRAFGFDPAGWRVAPLAAGTLSVLVLYLLARRLLGSTLAASLAAGLLALDFLHFVLSRSAMLDGFVVCFGLIAFLCLLYDRDRAAGTVGLRRRPWLLAAGVAGGAAVATKWSGGYLLAAIVALALVHAATRLADGGEAHPYRRVARAEGRQLLFALVLVPALLYIASYAGRLDGTWLAWPWAPGSWGRAFLTRQQLMISHHTGALFTHPYASPAWSWPLLKRPVLFYFRDPTAGEYQEILAVGNPLVWWPGLLALAATVRRLWRRRRAAEVGLSPELVILAGFAAGYLPWFVLSRREAFLYYFLPAVPFLCLALAQVVTRVETPRLRAAAIGGLTLASLGMFAFFRPVLSGTPLPYPQWRRRMVFTSCGGPEGGAVVGGLLKPVITPVPAPTGWCWV
jgi:dolichyl-phosphate-mannose-protein mannosyltransferase